MRILFVTAHKHLPELRGGMEVNTHELARRLLQKGMAVGALCGLAGTGMTGFKARLQMKLRGTACPVDHGLGYPVWRAWDSEHHVDEVTRAFKPDVFVIQGGSKFNELLHSCLATHIPVVCYLHTQDRLMLDEAVLAQPHLHFISNSEFTTSLHPEKKFAAIVRPIIIPEMYATTPDRSSVVFVNPASHKGVDIALGLASARPQIPFLFVINHSASMAKLALELGLEGRPNIKLIGPFDDMREVYKKAKLVLAPSQWIETWGRIATEAHLSGIPVLASNRGGLPEAVGPGGACLPADAPLTAWLERLDAMWNDPAYYAQLSDAARNHARRAETTPEHIVDSFVAVLRQAAVK